MARDFNYTTVDYIFSQLSRIPNYTLDEEDVVTDISIALGFMTKLVTQEEAVALLEVKNHIAEMPFGYSQIHRILRHNKNDDFSEGYESLVEKFLNVKNEGCVDCGNDEPISDLDDICTDCDGNDDCVDCRQMSMVGYSFPFQTFYGNNYIVRQFSIVKPSHNTFMSSLVCSSKADAEIYSSCTDEYSIQKGLKKKIVLSFPEGYIVVAFKRPITDPETGYPLIPDDSNANEAILSFVKAKIFENLSYAGREGFGNLAGVEREKWGKYLKQFNNAAKMPQTEDDYQSQLEGTLGGYANTKMYYGKMAGLSRRRRRI